MCKFKPNESFESIEFYFKKILQKSINFDDLKIIFMIASNGLKMESVNILLVLQKLKKAWKDLVERSSDFCYPQKLTQSFEHEI